MPDTATQTARGSYLMPLIQDATVADAMHPGIVCCEPDSTLTEVARIMTTHHVHCLAVVGVTREEPECGVWGIISDRDVLQAGIRGDGEGTARSLVQQPVVTVTSDRPLQEAGELMVTHGISHLVVTEPVSRRSVGILSTLDVAGVLAWGEA